MAEKLTESQEQYLEWLLLDHPQRVLAKLPTTKQEFALYLKVGERTLRKWQLLPEFQEALTARQAALVGKHTFSNAKAIDAQEIIGTAHTDAEQYEAIKDQLFAQALSGDKSAMKLYYDTYGKAHLENEAAARNTDLASFTTDELVLELCAVAGDSVLASYLISQGWQCSPPEASDA